ncbi:hypothetical protein GGS23DRAFT_600691 [Durotheca rogersii]|uniref:uncharacterized protein n=1 Tax=Durotheca rogersii TaxID=419775 RepID=UPI002220B29B|nr:uncharacterized protein GGS23DRAFT_600691 [Durotheca rogersii]KAI5858196.1 hypothetical protein GGS23DRAFT_600691 [Durotheca rogersii]
MLSLHIQNESSRWAAQQRPHRRGYPASSSPSANYPASGRSRHEEDSDDDSVCDSVFSASARSRRSSVSSAASDAGQAAAAAAAWEPPRDPGGGAPVATYASLEQAVAQSLQRVEAQGPRRLVTPGKLYENEEDDDEIVEADAEEPAPPPQPRPQPQLQLQHYEERYPQLPALRGRL